jgi:hypothetical protein
MPLNYKVLDNDDQKLQIKSAIENKEVSFRAFLTDLSQTFASNWSTEEVYGRLDPIATFSSTKRTISLAWDLPAADIEEAQQNLENCNTLMQLLYPSYVDTKEGNYKVISKNPLVKVKFGNLVSTSDNEPLLGWIDSVSWKPALDMGMFNDNLGEFYPKVISLSFNLNVLHQEDLSQNNTTSKKFPFSIL